MADILSKAVPNYTGDIGVSAVKRGKINPEALPNWQNVVIDENKLINYALDLENEAGKSKAVEFRDRLGIVVNNYRILQDQIIQQLPYYKAIKSYMSPVGQTYAVVMPITGTQGRKANIVAFFIDDIEMGKMRLSNARIVHGKDLQKWKK